MGTRASNGGCSDVMTLPISDWLFHIEGGTNPPYCAQFVNHFCIYIVFVLSAFSGHSFFFEFSVYTTTRTIYTTKCHRIVHKYVIWDVFGTYLKKLNLIYFLNAYYRSYYEQC